MDTEVLISFIVIAAIALIALGLWLYYRRRTSENLKERFGPEYDTTVRQFKSQDRAEAELKEREKRVSSYHIVSLPRAERDRYRETWRGVQGEFVDQPEKAVADADHLVRQVMERCGYPLRDFDQAAADLSVDHPHVVENYRAAYRIAERSGRGAADTEELRQAVVYYRALFEELLEDEGPRTTTKPKPAGRLREASHH
jgi:FtsZ-interacting cell division protein ZipA